MDNLTTRQPLPSQQGGAAGRDFATYWPEEGEGQRQLWTTLALIGWKAGHSHWLPELRSKDFKTGGGEKPTLLFWCLM